MNKLVRRKEHLINVFAFNENDEEVRNIVVDLGKDGKREWLFDFVLWATHNNLSIELERKV
jgi:hypothetical protein